MVGSFQGVFIRNHYKKYILFTVFVMAMKSRWVGGVGGGCNTDKRREMHTQLCWGNLEGKGTGRLTFRRVAGCGLATDVLCMRQRTR